MHFHYLELMNIMFTDVNPIPVKTAMNLFGFEAGECRLPLVPMSAGGYHDLKDCLLKYDLIDKYKTYSK
jgi:4-hydroxy-tetrahydrodipicolinate synthase